MPRRPVTPHKSSIPQSDNGTQSSDAKADKDHQMRSVRKKATASDIANGNAAGTPNVRGVRSQNSRRAAQKEAEREILAVKAAGKPAARRQSPTATTRTKSTTSQSSTSTKSRVEGMPSVNRLKALALIESNTKKWIKNANDERAVQEMGARFNVGRGEFAINWMQQNCYLYEGYRAGNPIQFMDYQIDFLMRLYSWVIFEDEIWHRWVRRFRRANMFVPKKNGKSPFEACNGLYVCFGEGEPGNKCYSLAFDKAQALIAHMHAVYMVEASPRLSDPRVCTINKGTWRILHHPSRSTYTVVSGDKHDRGGTSKEGFNGSIFVDETHGVTWDLMKRVKRAGISRAEPLMLQLSTAGPDLEGYGKAEFDFGERMNKGNASGEGDNKFAPRLLHVAFSPPPETTIADYRNPAKIERIIVTTNPAAGKLWPLSEAFDDWKDSVQQTEMELRDFAMYRTNLWLSSATAWIDGDKWQNSQRKYTLEDLKGYACFGGLDLSKISDMSALTCHWLVPISEDPQLEALIKQQEQEKQELIAHLNNPQIHKSSNSQDRNQGLQNLVNLVEMLADSQKSKLSGDNLSRLKHRLQHPSKSYKPEDQSPSQKTSPGGAIDSMPLDDSTAPLSGLNCDGLSLWYQGVRYILRSYTWLWMPTKAADKIIGYVDLFKWQDWITFIPEEVINYKDISDHIEWVREEFGMSRLAYDPNMSTDVITNLMRGQWYESELLQVPQRLATMSPLSQDYERGIISQSLQNCGNPVLDWMVGHCELYRAPSGQVKPVRPEFGSFKKIDGIISGIVGLACLREYGIDKIMSSYGFSKVLTAKEVKAKGEFWDDEDTQ